MTLLVAGSGCVHASVATAPNPWTPPVAYREILVWEDVPHLGARERLEERFAHEAAKRTMEVRLVPAYTVFYSGYRYEVEDMLDVLRETPTEAVLQVTLVDAGSQYNQIMIGEDTILGGDEPFATYSAHLVDVATGEIVWYATAELHGDIFTDRGDVDVKMVREFLAHLALDGFASPPVG